MTSAEKRTILEDAIDRGFKAISQASAEDLKSEEFGRLFINLSNLDSMRRYMVDNDACSEDCPGTSDAGTTKEALGVPSETPAPEPEESEKGRTSETGDGNTGSPAGRDSKPELEKEPEKPGSEKPEVETFKPAEVRAALASARLKGVNVAELLRKFGAGNFSALPESRYADVMQAVKQELADAA